MLHCIPKEINNCLNSKCHPTEWSNLFRRFYVRFKFNVTIDFKDIIS